MMVSVILLLIFLSTTCILSMNSQDLDLDRILSMRDESSSIINKLKTNINRFNCPKGWRYFGGSCYYLSNKSSTSIQVNQTCNLLHSNRSNLMQIRNRVELFYAANILIKNNLSTLMIEIDQNLLKDKRINSQDQWQHKIDYFHRDHILRKKFFDELNSINLRISSRSKKIGQNLIHNDSERMEDIGRVCDQIDLNIIDTNSTVYILTISHIYNKTVCLLNDVESDLKYKHICEYVLNYCFSNDECGKHGRCVNTVSSFKCSCSFFYDGLRCEKISRQGKQIILCLIIIFILPVLSTKIVRWTLMTVVQLCTYSLRRRNRNKRKKDNNAEVISREMMPMNRTKSTTKRQNRKQHHSTTAQETRPLTSSYRNKRNRIRLILVTVLTVLTFTVLISITIITHLRSFKYDIINKTAILITKCRNKSNYRVDNLIFSLIALILIIIFSWSIKRQNRCKRQCDGRPGLLPPIEPFGITNRFTTASVFGIFAFQIFEEFFVSPISLSNSDIIIDLIQKLGMILLIGLKYYPVLASLQLRNIIVRFLVCLYIIFDIFYTIIREGICIKDSPIPKHYSILEEAKLRMEMKTWYIIDDLTKNIPYFLLLSYICVELFIRLVYDSIYISIKRKRSVWSTYVIESDEWIFAKSYVIKLLRRSTPSNQEFHTDRLDDFESEIEIQRRPNLSRIKKFFGSIYRRNDDLYFTTIATCTYTVAIIFLYYFARILILLYIPHAKDGTSFIKYYIETAFNLEFQEFFLLKSTIIASGVIAFIIMIFHLFATMHNYKRHKLQLFKGIYVDIPSTTNFRKDLIAIRSVRYLGFLVGHTTFGFIVYFHLILSILIIIQLLSLQIIYIDFILAKILPVFVIYLLIMAIIFFMGKCLLSENIGKIYAIFVYFNFMIDCFLGMIVCIIRLIKAGYLNIHFMTRLDHSLYGRSVERFDPGFNAYISYLHMEVRHTNPIVLAFCYSLYDDIVRRRPKYCDSDEEIIEQKPKIIIDTENNDENSPSIDTPESEVKRVPNNPVMISDLISSDRVCGIHEIVQRKKQARFRWFLAYTILRNYGLFDLRKQVQARIARIHIIRSNLIDEEANLSTLECNDEQSHIQITNSEV